MAKTPEQMFLDNVKQQFKKATKEMAEQMTYVIERAYEGAIESFYKDYYPKWYRRTYSTYLGSNRAEDLFGYYHRGSVYESGIYVDPMFIPGKPYRADVDWVFDRTFSQGIHGFTLHDVQEWQDKRARLEWALSKSKVSMNEYRKYKMIRSWEKAGKLNVLKRAKFDREDFNQVMINAGKYGDAYARNINFGRTANLTYYSDVKTPNYMRRKTFGTNEELGFITRFASHRHVHTTPKRLMDADFKDITKKKNMKKMFDGILSNYIN